ncbi:MAG TPA: hypothetical protein VH307_06230 [Streptosporangiaceae bacterium]|nr:hypothetical protein [Streptosporangiaceae bacterium]
MPDDDDTFWARMPHLQADPVRAPEPPGGFRRLRKPTAMRTRQRQREAEVTRLRLEGIFRVGAAIVGAAVVVVAILVIVLIVQEH